MSTYVEFGKKFDNSKSTQIQIWNDISPKLKKNWIFCNRHNIIFLTK